MIFLDFPFSFNFEPLNSLRKLMGKLTRRKKKKTIASNTCGDAQHQKKKNNKLNQLFRAIDHVIYLCKDYIIDTI